MIDKFDKKYSLKKAFEEELIFLAKYHKNFVVVNSDFSSRLGLTRFSEVFPERQFNFGLAEQNAVGISVGLNIRGKIPMICGFANFSLTKALEVIRDAVCYPNLNIKFVSFGAGFGEDREGEAYQSFEDISFTRVLPNMKVFCAADSIEVKAVLKTMMNEYGPTYLRISSEKCPIIHDESYDFKSGEIDVLEQGKDLLIFAIGPMVYRALEVSDMLKNDGINATVCNFSSIKPVDEQSIKRLTSNAKLIVTIEDHNVYGGIGGVISEILADYSGAKLKIIGVNDKFGKSAKINDLYADFGLDTASIYENIKGFLKLEGLL